MKKLLELKSLDTEVRELLQTVETPAGVYLCAHMYYIHPKVSIYTESTSINKNTTQIMQNNVLFEVDIDIDEQVIDEIIAKIEKVMQ